MAKSCAMLLVGLVMASTLCVANVGAAEPGRKLLLAELGATLRELNRPFDLVIHFDLTQLPERVDTGTATLVETAAGIVIDLVSGKVNMMTAANVMLANGVVYVRLQILGVDKVIALDLVKLKAVLVGTKLELVVVFVLDEVEQILHLRDVDGNCQTVDMFNINVGIDFRSGVSKGLTNECWLPFGLDSLC